MEKDGRISSSFRDPSGFVFCKNGEIYRQIQPIYRETYRLIQEKRLFEILWEEQLLVPHREVKNDASKIVIQPDRIPFISYPYEWSFGQLQDAALCTLKVQKRLLENGFSLKDASAYNVQFIGYRPIFIDTLSFEPYREGPWVAFGQFCKHFLYPLWLMSRCDLRLNRLAQNWLDGIPGDLADALLPFPKYFSLAYWLYIFLPNRSQKKHSSDRKKVSITLKRKQILQLTDGLMAAIRRLKPKHAKTVWGEYYTFTNYSEESFREKRAIVERWLERLHPSFVWDCGANNGYFSRLASSKNIPTVAWDFDPVAVEKNYQQAKAQQESYMLPLLCDVTNPSPGIGWANEERTPMEQRGTPDVAMALALIHHLAIGNNLPFYEIARYFARCSPYWIVEFIPKNDSKVQELLLHREDIFDAYTQENFLKDFSAFFSVEERVPIAGSLRTLFLLKRL